MLGEVWAAASGLLTDVVYETMGFTALWTPMPTSGGPAARPAAYVVGEGIPLRLLPVRLEDQPLDIPQQGRRTTALRRFTVKCADLETAISLSMWRSAEGMLLTSPPPPVKPWPGGLLVIPRVAFVSLGWSGDNDVREGAETLKITGTPWREDMSGREWTFDAQRANPPGS